MGMIDDSLGLTSTREPSLFGLLRDEDNSQIILT